MSTQTTKELHPPEDDLPNRISVSWYIEKHLDASRRYPGRNFIVKDKNDLDFSSMSIEKMYDSETGEPLRTSQGGQQMYAITSRTKMDVIPMIAGVEDKSPDALTKAYIVFGALGIPAEGDQSLWLMIHSIVKVFDENKEILLEPTKTTEADLLFDIRRHEDASRQYSGRSFIIKHPSQLELVKWNTILPRNPETEELEKDKPMDGSNFEFQSNSKLEIIPLIGGVEDTSPDALTEAFITFTGSLTLNPSTGAMKPVLKEMVKAFHEDREILIDTKGMMDNFCVHPSKFIHIENFRLFHFIHIEDRHLSTSAHKPRRNVIFNNPDQFRSMRWKFEMTLDSETGEPLLNVQGLKMFTIQSLEKFDVTSIVDEVIEDSSPNALTKAYILFRGTVAPDPIVETFRTRFFVEDMVKAFDENHEILIDHPIDATSYKEDEMDKCDSTIIAIHQYQFLHIRERHFNAACFPGINVIFKYPEQLESMCWKFEMSLNDQTGENLLDSKGNKKFTIQSMTMFDVQVMVDGIEEQSSTALAKAYVVFSGIIRPHPVKKGDCVFVQDMLKAFNENQDIIIDIPIEETKLDIIKGRNVIIRDREQFSSVSWMIEVTSNPKTGMPKFDSKGRPRITLESREKLDVVPMIDGVADTSHNALSKAFVIFNGVLDQDRRPIIGNMVMAFDENQGFMIDNDENDDDIDYNEVSMILHNKGRNVLIKDMSQVTWRPPIMSLDPKTGGQLFDADGNMMCTIQSKNKVDIIPMIDGLEDKSRKALRKAFLLCRAYIEVDPETREEKIAVCEMIKAFDKHQEIIIDN